MNVSVVWWKHQVLSQKLPPVSWISVNSLATINLRGVSIEFKAHETVIVCF